MSILIDNDLEKVVGGTIAHAGEKAVFATKKEEFEAAWDALKMEKKGYTGNMRAELYDDWESTDYSTSAISFLAKIK